MMRKTRIVFFLVVVVIISTNSVRCVEASTIVLSVECKNIRMGGAAAKLSPAFEDTHKKWVIRCPGASATKISESPTGAQWRIKPMKKEVGNVIVLYRDEFDQQHLAGSAMSPSNSSMEMTMRRMVNHLQIGKTANKVTAVYFAKSGKKASLSDADKCLSSGTGTYDFPAIWQGPQKAWSLYIKKGTEIIEIPAAGNFFGLWGNFSYSEQDGKANFAAKPGHRKLNSN